VEIEGRAWKYGDGLTTDYMLPGKYLELTDPSEMAEHAMEGIDLDFTSKVGEGDVIVAGKNCGLGSSREHAPLALKYSGIRAIIAESFARIFYRNSYNVGLLAIECPDITKVVVGGDIIKIDLERGRIIVNQKEELKFVPPPNFMIRFIEEGGLVPYLKENLIEW
jgi:3-isopropylmalate/(R)-2-methylmalate dehydratase small subunit